MLFVVKTTHRCNLACGYCFDRPGSDPPAGDICATVEALLAGIEKAGIRRARIILHGGEPLLLGAATLERLFALSSRIRSLQTNLTLLDDELIALFRRHGVVVGASFDGLGSPHRPGQELVQANIRRLLDAGVRVNAIAVLTRSNASEQALGALLGQLVELGIGFKFNYGVGTPDQLSPGEYAEVALRLFKRCIPLIMEQGIEIRPWTHYLENPVGLLPPRDCSFSGCQLHRKIVGIMPNGDITTCCRHTGSEVFGNVHADSLKVALNHPARQRYVDRYAQLLAGPCRGCRFWRVCFGGCLAEIDPATGVSYHCEATKRILHYTLTGALEADFPQYDFLTWVQNRLEQERDHESVC